MNHPQGNGGAINAPLVVPQGGSIPLTIGPNDTTVEVTDGSGTKSSMTVEPGKNVTIPVPNAPGGSFLSIRVGDGNRWRIHTVEVIAPGP